MASRARAQPGKPGNKQQAVSLARRMAGKKGAVVQLQAEINTEEDWEKLIAREGLIVVDVYCDWCGPCVGMIGNLKKVKLEIGGDMLHLAIAKSDEIEALKRFRNQSEPTWMFISSGKLIYVMFGANAPRLMQMIEAELKEEQRVQKGEAKRKGYQFDELTPEEEERAAIAQQQQLEKENMLRARELAAKNDERDRLYKQMLGQMVDETFFVCFPHCLVLDVCEFICDIESQLAELGITFSETTKVKITPEMWDEITYRETQSFSTDYQACMELGNSLAVLVKWTAPPEEGGLSEVPGNVERMVWECINQNNMEVGVPSEESIPSHYKWKKVVQSPAEAKASAASINEDMLNRLTQASVSSALFEETDVYGLYTPMHYMSKCAGIAALFPVRTAKIPVTFTSLPPRMALVFEPEKGPDCFALADEMPDEVLGIGYFTTADPDSTVLLAKTMKRYSKLPYGSDYKLVVSVAKRVSEPMLSFAALGPIYVSPDLETGAMESDKFFPPGEDIEDPIEEEEEED